MIKLPEGELRDYLPVTMKNDVDMICLSYAIKKESEQLAKYRKATMIYRFIDSVPEPILDLLAVELRSLYYSDALPIETKRGIVKNTLRWHMQAGTPGAVAEMVKIVFGGGEVVEWPDFDEPPYTPGTFDIITDARLTPDTLAYFLSVIDRVKNVRSHLRRLLIKRKTTLTVYAGIGNTQQYKPAAIIGGYQVNRLAGNTVHAGACCSQQYKPAAIIDGYQISRLAHNIAHTGVAGTSRVHQEAVRETLEYKSKVQTDTKTGMGLMQASKPAAVIDGGTRKKAGTVPVYAGVAIKSIAQKAAAVKEGGKDNATTI